MKIGVHEYQIRKLDGRKQFHVMRRMGPLVMHVTAGDIGAAVTALAQMKDEDVDYVLDACLAVVARRQDLPTGVMFADVMPRPGMCMFSDLTADDMMQLAVAVVQDSLGSFFDMTQSASAAAVK